jgi:hypothetical protein
MADKPVLVSVTSAHTIFGFFETFCEHASRTKLRGKTKIVFFGPRDQKLWVFEVSRRSLGRAGMCWSQPARVDHLHKKWRAGRKKIQEKWELPHRRRCRPAAGLGPPTCGQRPLVAAHRSAAQGRLATRGRCPQVGSPRPAGDQQSPAGRGSTPAPVGQFNFFILKKRIFGSLGDGPGLLREWVYSANSSKIHGEWRFHFFP